MVRRRCTCALQLRVTLTLACGIFGVRVARAQTQCDAPIAAKTATDILLTMQSMSKSISTCAPRSNIVYVCVGSWALQQSGRDESRNRRGDIDILATGGASGG